MAVFALRAEVMAEGEKMGKQREPTNLVLAKGKKHFSQAEIEMRQAREVMPNFTPELCPPSWLNAKEKKRFRELRDMLASIDVIGDTDTMMLAHCVNAETLALTAVKDNRRAIKDRDSFLRFIKKNGETIQENFEIYKNFELLVNETEQRIIKCRNQLITLAKSLCLTIDSRCRIQVPQIVVEEKVNKFQRFEKEEQQA